MTLDGLFGLMKSGTKEEWEAAGLTWIEGYISDDEDDGEGDWSNLPVFGSRQIENDADLKTLTGGPLWSWDDTRAIVGTYSEDIAIVDIAETAKAYRQRRQARSF